MINNLSKLQYGNIFETLTLLNIETSISAAIQSINHHTNNNSNTWLSWKILLFIQKTKTSKYIKTNPTIGQNRVINQLCNVELSIDFFRKLDDTAAKKDAINQNIIFILTKNFFNKVYYFL